MRILRSGAQEAPHLCVRADSNDAHRFKRRTPFQTPRAVSRGGAAGTAPSCTSRFECRTPIQMMHANSNTARQLNRRTPIQMPHADSNAARQFKSPRAASAASSCTGQRRTPIQTLHADSNDTRPFKFQISNAARRAAGTASSCKRRFK
jgi:hypothetical protein